MTTAGPGGFGGGGAGGNADNNAVNGTVNTGGGGGGARANNNVVNTAGGNGGSGVVIVSYATPVTLNGGADNDRNWIMLLLAPQRAYAATIGEALTPRVSLFQILKCFF